MVTGGTSMLFSWKSGTAVNAMTAGNVHIKLQEADYNETGDHTWKDINSSFTGVTFDNDIYPGSTIDKYAQVINDGEGNAYLKITAEISFDNEPVTGPVGGVDWTDTNDAHRLAIMHELMNYLEQNGNASGLTDNKGVFGSRFFAMDGGFSANGIWTINYYYVDDKTAYTPGAGGVGGTYPTLSILPGNGEDAQNPMPSVVFLAGMTLPKYAYAKIDNTDYQFFDTPQQSLINGGNYNEVFDYMFDIKPTIKFTAYAVQSDYNPYISGADPATAFTGQSWTNQD